MSFKLNETYNGFKLVSSYTVEEINSLARVFEHEKSGAKLLAFENDDDNKVFSVSFRTPPSDSTGVPHIVEHCVLSGSRKYHTKEPFMDMVKGSLNTFINAMTFNDKTVYPVASRNTKDFFNLMDVYLDAVFYPKMDVIPEIFAQEGWHFDINAKDDSLKYTGVVYNEMLGAYSDPSTILSETIAQSLYPDTCYKHSSGGDPEFIPDLTFDEFNNFHKKYYHPSNSYFYLYGNGDLSEQLKFINDEYLASFDKCEIDSNIEIQKPFSSQTEHSSYYGISDDESEENKSYLSMNYVVDTYTNSESYMMIKILEYLLVESSSSPLKKALLDAGIGEDILFFDNDALQPSISIVAKHTSEDLKDKFQDIIKSTLEKMISEGIDKDLILSCINKVEFDLREASYFPTKGIIYHLLSMDSWLYCDDPTSHIQYNKVLNNIREKTDAKFFESFIDKYMLKNPHCSYVSMNAKKGLSAETTAVLEKKLEDIKSSFSAETIDKMISDNATLKERQLAPDTPEAVATMPALQVEDVDSVADIIPQEVIKEADITILNHEIFSNNIAYVDFVFDVTSTEQKHIPYINLLADILGKVDTEDMTYSELSNEIYINTGGITSSSDAYIVDNDVNDFRSKLTLSGKAIGDNLKTMFMLMNKLLLNSKFDDASRIKELLQQIKSRLEMGIFSRGIGVVGNRISSYHSKSSSYSEQLKGLGYFWFISDLVNNFDSNTDEILSTLKEVYAKLFNKNGLIVSFTGDNSDFEIFKSNYASAVENLTSETPAEILFDFTPSQSNEGILSSANVQYVGKGYNFKKLGFEFTGSMKVLETILNGEYLHDRVRAKGGAYGCRSSFRNSGNFNIVSYRDPNLVETFDVYDDTADFIQNFELDKATLTKFIIGTMSNVDGAETPHMKGETATAYYISNTSQEEIQKMRDEILNTSSDDIKALADILRASMDMEHICVLGNSDKIEAKKELFNNLVQLKK